ncbi:MAG: DUF1902 domain-containing protein [Amphiplicatus sp.]
MSKRTFFVRACWDAEAKVYYAESDIEGLHIEADTIEEFESVMMDLAPELIVVNHFEASELARTPLKDLMPAILWQRPENDPACA